MPPVALVVEGNYDEDVLKTLIQRIREGPVDVHSRPCGGPLPGRYVRRLNELQYDANFEKALVVSDAHGKRPEVFRVELEREIQNRQFPFPVHFVVILQELEAWLLADHSALNAVARARGGVATFGPLTVSPEQNMDPKRELRRLLATASIPYTRPVAREIAESANLQTIEYWCPSFRRFRQVVIDP